MNNNLSGRPRNLSGGVEPAESETAQLVARARVMMIISALTTVLAIAAVVAVIGYRVFGTGIGPVAGESSIELPKGAHIVSMAASAGRIAVLLDVNGTSEIRTFDIKTLKQTGGLHFSTEP
jgi:hypothetical protein